MAPSLSSATHANEDPTTPRSTAINYDLAGRLPNQPFLDLRSAAKARHRHRANLEKYYSYRYVNAGQLGRPHHELPVPCHHPQELPSDTPVAKMTKQDLYREAQRYPRPPKYHRKHVDFLRAPKTARKERERHARKHARLDLDEAVAEAGDPVFVAYVTGRAEDDRDLDGCVFRHCEICRPEVGCNYMPFALRGGNGEVVAEWEDCWEVGLERGFAGRAKVGEVFLQGRLDEGDWRGPRVRWRGLWDEDEEWEVEKEGEEEDVGEDGSWSWADDFGSLKEEAAVAEAEWEMLSSCSSWSEVSG